MKLTKFLMEIYYFNLKYLFQNFIVIFLIHKHTYKYHLLKKKTNLIIID